MFEAVAGVFNEVQLPTASIRAQSHQLWRIHKVALAEDRAGDFTTAFVRCLEQIATVKRTERVADRITDFCRAYVALVVPESADGVEESPDDDVWMAFAEDVVAYFLQGFSARLPIVRFRSMSIVLSLLSLVPLTEDRLQEIRERSLQRATDKDTAVRVQAVMLMAALDYNPEPDTQLVQALLDRLNHDPAAEVRRAAVYNIRHSRDLLPQILERVRDENVINRRIMFRKILPSIEDFRLLSIATREDVLRAGLQDRDAAVRRATGQLLRNAWLRQVNNDIIELLRRLDVMTCPDVAELVLNALFELRPDILRTKVMFGAEFWAGMCPEQATILRCFQDFCREHKLTDLIEQRMPEPAELGSRAREFWAELCRAEATGDSELRAEWQFVVEELLRVCTLCDYDDEGGRRVMVDTLDQILRSSTAPSDRIVSHAMWILRKLAASDDDALLYMLELLSDISDGASGTGPDDSDGDDEVLTRILKILAIVKATLERVNSISNPEYLDTIWTDYLGPSIQSPAFVVRTRATTCLCLVCVVSASFADHNFGGFLAGIQQVVDDMPTSQEDIEECALVMRCVVEILMAHQRPQLIPPTVDVLVSFADHGPPPLQAAAASGLARLVLSFQCIRPDVIQRLVLRYLATSVVEDRILQQDLSLFLRAFSLDPEGKLALAMVVDDVYHAFFKTYGTDMIKPATLVALLVDLTLPQPGGSGESHLILSRGLLRIIQNEPGAEARRSVASWLPKLEVEKCLVAGADPEEVRHELSEARAAVVDHPKSRPTVGYLDKFEHILNQARGSVTRTESTSANTDNGGRNEDGDDDHRDDESGDKSDGNGSYSGNSPDDRPDSNSDSQSDSESDQAIASHGNNVTSTPTNVSPRAHAGSEPEPVSSESFSDVTPVPMEHSFDMSTEVSV